MDSKAKIGRLAFREEGDFWHAYYALPNTMKDAIFLGSIRMTIVRDWQAKELFMALMRDAVSAIIKAETGITPDWPGEQPAPEHERPGKA